MKTMVLFKNLQSDLKKVEKFLFNNVQFENPQLKEGAVHLLEAGGKRIRPAFAILGARFGPQNDIEQLLPLSASLELIHMASLVHDDVIDDSFTRRGRPTLRAITGNSFSLVAGDYYFAKALSLLGCYQEPRIYSVLADVSVEMCEGEIQQIVSTYDVNQSLRDYFYRIKRKTALLISASCQVGSLAAGADDDTVWKLGKIGHYLGMAFQIVDDILDFISDPKVLGKPVASDLRQGIITLPTICALKDQRVQAELQSIINSKNIDDVKILRAISLIKDVDGIGQAYEIADLYIRKAKKMASLLPENEAKDSLFKLADYIGKRQS